MSSTVLFVCSTSEPTPRRPGCLASPTTSRWCTSNGCGGRVIAPWHSTARPLLNCDFSRTALYGELAERTGVQPCSGWERIHPELPTTEQRSALGIRAKQPVFAIERVTYGPDRQHPIEWRHSIVRGDMFAFVARWDSRDASGASGAMEAEVLA